MQNTVKAGRAAAILAFTSGVEDFEMAARLFDAIENAGPDVTLGDVFEKFPGVCKWEKVETLSDVAWFGEVSQLAQNFTQAAQQFGGE